MSKHYYVYYVENTLAGKFDSAIITEKHPLIWAKEEINKRNSSITNPYSITLKFWSEIPESFGGIFL